MASITTRGKKNANTRASGSKNIAFMDGNRKRRTIILGDVPQKVAEEICRRVEYLAAAKDNGVAIDADTARWVNDVQEKNPVLAAKLAKDRTNPTAADERGRRNTRRVSGRLFCHSGR